MIKTIICKICGKETPDSHKGKKFYCPECKKSLQKEWGKKCDTKRRKTKHRKEWKEKWKEKYRDRKRSYDKDYYQKNKDKILKYSKEYREEHKEECRMRGYACRWLKKELLIKAKHKCEKCGNTESLQLHHKEYTQINKKQFRGENMMKIQVLCAICHKKEHLKPSWKPKEKYLECVK